MEYLLPVLAVLVAALVVVNLLLLRGIAVAGQSRDHVERALREEMASSRQEAAIHNRELRQELNTELRGQAATLDQRLAAIQQDNERRLEQMRQTVAEKLEGALEQRLGESFRIVSERLEQVHQGLGEMRNLAAGVGDLKRVLSNVKARGVWGEVQLGSLLEQVLAPEQYEKNVATTGGVERVEFAVKLPGKDEHSAVWLPIDAKFPLEDYQRLVEASERGDTDATDAASRQLESRLKTSARELSAKYISPPATTDFGILFLPTEGLYAEALRRPALADMIQRDFRVMLAGPTTLAALLNSLQMGFRTLAIQKRSGEVWELLARVKTEFTRYADLLAKVRKKLDEAGASIDTAEQKSRRIVRSLQDVEDPVEPTLALDFGEPWKPL